MNKSVKKKFAVLGILVVVLSFLLLCGCGTSEGNPYDNYPDNGYEIDNLSVKIDASAGNRSMRITEEYTFKFSQLSHGFYRDFALNSGEKIRNIKVYNADSFSSTFKVSHESSDILRLRVGSEYSYVGGPGNQDKQYKCTIEYTMITPPHADYPDALAVNAIGQGWSCKIKQADIKVILPKETNETPMYYYGKWGETNNAVDDKIVSDAPESGSKEYSFAVRPKNGYGYALNAYEGLTLYYFMPKGAFSAYIDWQIWVVLALGLILIGVAVFLNLTIGKDPIVVPVTNYYPPKHVGAGERELPMDPVDMGYLIDNTCQGEDVTSLIFYFASRGYLDLIEPNSDDNDSDSFKLVKNCDLPGDVPKYQKTFFNKIFAKSDSVTVSDLTNKTYTAVQSVKAEIQNKYKGKLFSGKAQAASVGMSVGAILFAVLTVCLSSMRVYRSYFNFFGLVAIGPAVISSLFGMYIVHNRFKFGAAKRTALLVLFGIITLIASLLLVAVTKRDVLGTAETVILVVSVAASCMLAPFISRRTDYYTRELEQITGFKDFLQTVEKDKLETLLEENPQYYYDILPYANVLGVSDIWEDKFKNLTLEPPVYYRGNTMFTFIVFNNYYHRSYRAYSVATVSVPSSSSSSRSGGGIHFGGGGHGGGFSGGGFGGGGGGRW